MIVRVWHPCTSMYCEHILVVLIFKQSFNGKVLTFTLFCFQLAEASAVSHYHETELKQMRAQVGKKR